MQSLIQMLQVLILGFEFCWNMLHISSKNWNISKNWSIFQFESGAIWAVELKPLFPFYYKKWCDHLYFACFKGVKCGPHFSATQMVKIMVEPPYTLSWNFHQSVKQLYTLETSQIKLVTPLWTHLGLLIFGRAQGKEKHFNSTTFAIHERITRL